MYGKTDNFVRSHFRLFAMDKIMALILLNNITDKTDIICY